MLTTILVAVLVAAAHAMPLTASPYALYGECFRLDSPTALLQHPLVVLGKTRSAATDAAVTALLSGLSRDYALRLCSNVALQAPDAELVPQNDTPEQALPLEHFDCDILAGDFSLGVSRDFDQNKAPVHAVFFQDPVEATLATYNEILSDPAHPKHAKLAAMSLHDAIVEAGGMSDTDRFRASLEFNAMTWRLCGFDCSPENMTIHTALERATHNLNVRVIAVLTENSPLWSDLLQATVRDPFKLSAAKRKPKLVSALTTAEQSILEHSNFADRILYSIAQGREVQQRKCLRTMANLPRDQHIRI